MHRVGRASSADECTRHCVHEVRTRRGVLAVTVRRLRRRNRCRASHSADRPLYQARREGRSTRVCCRLGAPGVCVGLSAVSRRLGEPPRTGMHRRWAQRPDSHSASSRGSGVTASSRGLVAAGAIGGPLYDGGLLEYRGLGQVPLCLTRSQRARGGIGPN